MSDAALQASPERPETFRQTLLARYDKCPASAALYLKHDGGPPSIEKDRGTALHEGLERAQNYMIEHDEPRIPGEVARDFAEAVMTENTELVLPTREQDSVRAQAYNWAESPQGTLDFQTILGIEMPLELEIGGVKCTCRLDRAEASGSTLYIYDWKSGWPGKREDTEQSFQGQFYAMALLWGTQPTSELSFGAGINDVYFFETFPRIRDEDSKALTVLEGAWSRSELYIFKQALERNIGVFVDTLLGDNEWEARDGSWCGRCAAPTECPIPAHLRQIEEIRTPEDAEVALSHKLALDRDAERLQTGLREWFKENGVIYLGDYAFDAKTSKSRSVKDWDALQVDLREGVSPDTSSSVKDRVSTKYAPRKLTKEELRDHPS